MCDYSLLGIPNRLAVEGEQLLVYRFPTGSLGLTSRSEICAPATELADHSPAGWWSAIKSWFSVSVEKSTPAVCIPPGAQLVLHDIPPRLQQKLEVTASEEVTFVQLSDEVYTYRDAVRFHNGRDLLLQRLDEGQRVEVRCLSLAEEAPRPLHPAEVALLRRA